MKKWVQLIGFVAAAGLVLAGCGSSSQGSGAANVANGAAKEITIHAKNFEFDQKEIKVNKGDTVKITLENTQGVHGLKIEGYNKEIQAGKPVTFVADKAGEFKFECAIVCGAGHQDMTGKLIVQ